MGEEPYFRRDGERFAPTRSARGPWRSSSLHGRVVCGLLAREIERRHGGPDYLPARLTVDMYRLPDLSPIEIVTRVVRDGYRIKVIDAELLSAGASAARASVQLLRRGEAPEGAIWSPPSWDAPGPETLPKREDVDPRMPLWDMRFIAGAMGTMAPKRVWMREIREMIEGEPVTPFTRVALAADFASPFANAGDKGLLYINSDVTLYLCRLPTTPWVGLEAVNHQAADGVAIGECWVYDEAGPIGSASVAALAQPRRL
ncbi:MAG: thioesterase family protein [Caulobacteraceae bacterium]|nr:thioesterase family protein [Caulobacteraceae bacterium]